MKYRNKNVLKKVISVCLSVVIVSSTFSMSIVHATSNIENTISQNTSVIENIIQNGDNVDNEENETGNDNNNQQPQLQDITDISISKIENLEYDGTEKEIVTVNGDFQVGDNITWTVNDIQVNSWTVSEQNINEKNIPKEMAVGIYDVTLKIERTGYNPFECNCTVEINKGSQIDLGDLSVTGYSGVYDSQEHEAVQLENANANDYTLMYQLSEKNDENAQPNENNWTEQIPKVKYAGSYIIWVKAVKNNYNDTDIDVNKPQEAQLPYNVIIKKASTNVSFEDVNDEYEMTYDQLTQEGLNISLPIKVMDANNQPIENISLEYQVSEENNNQTEATINNDRELNVKKYGKYTISVKVVDDNYENITYEKSISVRLLFGENNLIFFEQNNVEYTLNYKSNIISQQQVKFASDYITKNIIYNIKNVDNMDNFANLDDMGLSFDIKNGNLSVIDYNTLATAIDASENDTLSFNITATKEAESYCDEDIATYTVNIKFLETPENAYTISGKMVNDSTWYISAVTLSATEQQLQYKFAKSLEELQVDDLSSKFQDSIVFDDEGDKKRYIYISDSDGRITNKVEVNIKIDTQKPDCKNMIIEVDELNLIESIADFFGFYNPKVKINFIVHDENGDDESGIKKINWKFTNDTSKKGDELYKDYQGTINITDENKTDDGYVATLELTADEYNQYRGKISFVAYDIAGLSSDVKSEDKIIVVDTVSPKLSIRYETQSDTSHTVVDNKHYYNGDVDVYFDIDEYNFFKEDVVISVTKDGHEFTDYEIEWTESENSSSKNTAKITLNNDGDYVFKLNYKDKSGNEVEFDDIQQLNQSENEYNNTFISDTIVIDKTAPIASFEYDRNEQSIKLTIIEKNFDESKITVLGTITDINVNDVDFTYLDVQNLFTNGVWMSDGDTHSIILNSDVLKNGIYDIAINFEDIAKNQLNEKVLSNFTIDKTNPSNIEINYSTPLLEKLIEDITFGYYKPNVNVTFTSYDNFSQVTHFTWGYVKQEGASDINRPTDSEDLIKTQTIQATQNSQDKSKYTATITLSATQAEQIRGYVHAIATDEFNNKSELVTDNQHILVVDTINPKLSVTYPTPNNTVGNTSYYNTDITVYFNITEANFYSEDVRVYLSKDGAQKVEVKPNWESSNSDFHVGSYILNEDGDYKFYVEYTDRSQNQMIVEDLDYVSDYESNIITIDKTKPIITVDYDNKEIINTLIDDEQNTRNYYNKIQTATITIKEHNFNSNDVIYNIIAKDVTGQVINQNNMISKSAWESNGDMHTMKISYMTDANYIFDVKYSDLATNSILDYNEYYFTVDRTKPQNISIDYSTSVLDTILENITFGFYKSNVKVTITAQDDISKINTFQYSYITASGVSVLNSSLENQVITQDNIRYLNNSKTAVAEFYIPKDNLNTNNQFNGYVEFLSYDRSNNESDVLISDKRLVVDNISPKATISYNKPVNTFNNISYYNGDITGTITVNEANFYSEDVIVTASKDGNKETIVNTTWVSQNIDTHTGTFTLSEDGDYIITIKYSDKSGNNMVTYTSAQLTIDTTVNQPTFSINGNLVSGNAGAYKNDLTVSYSYEDKNYLSKSISLTKYNLRSTEDVTSKYIQVQDTENGGNSGFSIPTEVEDDAIYLLTISMKDKANNEIQSQLKFTANRYGSVYEYNDYLSTIIKNGGQYLKIEDGNTSAVTNDIVITEYNATEVKDGTLNILITKDGQSSPNDYEITVNSILESGWHKYTYDIPKENFEEDGLYKISLYSKYDAVDSLDNVSSSLPINSLDNQGNKIIDTISFVVDTISPNLKNVTNLDRSVVNSTKLDVKYSIMDVGGLANIDIMVDGKIIQNISDFSDNVYSYTGQFTMLESDKPQNVRFIITDIAGNVTDTDSTQFKQSSSYTFNNEIVISTNLLVRWFANKPLFIGSIGLVLVIFILLILVLLLFVRQSDDDEEKKKKKNNAN